MGGVLFLEGSEFRKFFGGGGAPSGPEVEEDEFSAEGGGVEGLACGEIGEGHFSGELERGEGGGAGGEKKRKKAAESKKGTSGWREGGKH